VLDAFPNFAIQKSLGEGVRDLAIELRPPPFSNRLLLFRSQIDPLPYSRCGGEWFFIFRPASLLLLFPVFYVQLGNV